MCIDLSHMEVWVDRPGTSRAPQQEAPSQVGDIVRAVSFVGAGPEPGWLDKMLGAESMPMQQAIIPNMLGVPSLQHQIVIPQNGAVCDHCPGLGVP